MQKYEGEKIDCLNDKAQLGSLPYKLHIAIRYGEAARDYALALAGYNGYEDRITGIANELMALEKEVVGWAKEDPMAPRMKLKGMK